MAAGELKPWSSQLTAWSGKRRATTLSHIHACAHTYTQSCVCIYIYNTYSAVTVPVSPGLYGSQFQFPRACTVLSSSFPGPVRFSVPVSPGLYGSQFQFPRACTVLSSSFPGPVRFSVPVSPGLYGSQFQFPRACTVLSSRACTVLSSR